MAKKATTAASKKAPMGASRKPAAKKVAKRALPRNPTTHKLTAGGLYVPAHMAIDSSGHVVPAGKLQQGLVAAKKQISSMIQEIVDTATEDYEIAEIEFAASFSAEGKFLGFGVGGEATIVIRIRPCE